MSNISVDLKVIEVTAPMVARALNEPVALTLGGLNLLWHRCWSLKSDTITSVGLAGIFGPEKLDVRIAQLVDAGFLEAAGVGFRIKGAERYLRIKAGNSKGGHAAKGNLIPGGKRPPRAEGEPRGEPSATPEDTSAHPSGPLGSSPNTEHRTPNTKETTLVEQAPLLPVPAKPPRLRPMALDDKTLTDDEWAVFDHWRVECQHPKALLDTKRQSLIRRWLATPGITVLRLQKAITGCSKSAWHRGENPSRKRYDDLELILRDAKQLEQFEGAAA